MSTDNGDRRLARVLPRAGFIWRGHRHVLSRIRVDNTVKSAMCTHGGDNFRFCRADVTKLLVDMFAVLEDAFLVHDTGFGGFMVALINAITLLQTEITWTNALSQAVLVELILEIARARGSYVNQHPEVNNEDGEADLEGTAATELHSAITAWWKVVSAIKSDGRWENDADVMALGEAARGLDLAAAAGGDAGGDDAVTNDQPSGPAFMGNLGDWMAQMEEDEDELMGEMEGVEYMEED